MCSNKNVFYMLCIHIYITLEECQEYEFDDIVSCCPVGGGSDESNFSAKRVEGGLCLPSLFFFFFFSVEEQSTLAAGR